MQFAPGRGDYPIGLKDLGAGVADHVGQVGLETDAVADAQGVDLAADGEFALATDDDAQFAAGVAVFGVALLAAGLDFQEEGLDPVDLVGRTGTDQLLVGYPRQDQLAALVGPDDVDGAFLAEIREQVFEVDVQDLYQGQQGVDGR